MASKHQNHNAQQDSSCELTHSGGGALAQLATIRERGAYSSRNSSKGALLNEAQIIFSAIRSGKEVEDVRREIMEARLFQKASFENRCRIWDLLKFRYFAPKSNWIISALAEASSKGARSPEFTSLAYLYYALRDRMVFDFVTGPIWRMWLDRSRAVGTTTFFEFLKATFPDHPEVKRWREATRAKVGQSNLAALRDFGLLQGVQNKQIQRPTANLETAFHLLCVLKAEGHHGRSVLEAPDWRLFLWGESDVTDALHRMALARWIRFERGGRTVILELIREPEVNP